MTDPDAVLDDTVRLLIAATTTQVDAMAAQAERPGLDIARDAAEAAGRAADRGDAVTSAADAARSAARPAIDIAVSTWSDDARDPAWASTVTAAWDTAVGAAVAAAVADLVGEHGYTPDHHQTLAGPFTTAFPDSALADTIDRS